MSNLLEKCLNNKMMCSGIFIFIVIIIVLVIYFSTRTTTNTPNNSAPYNKAVVNAAIASSGIKIITENFQNELVYDSVDKIKQNFTTFMNTYYPFLDINTMNKMLKEDYGINKTIQEIINDHPDVYFTRYLTNLAGYSMFLNMALDNQTDTILCGLGYITIMKLNIPKDTYDLYYLDDYDQMNDFVIYYIPTSFDKTKITNTNSEIDFPPSYNDSVLFPNTVIDVKPFKFGFKNLNESKIKQAIEYADTKAGKTTSSITESDINNFLNIVKANKNSLIRYNRLLSIAPFIKLHTNETITTSSKVISDIRDLFNTNKYFNSDIIKYLPSADFISDNMSRLIDTIFIPN